MLTTIYRYVRAQQSQSNAKQYTSILHIHMHMPLHVDENLETRAYIRRREHVLATLNIPCDEQHKQVN